MDFTLYCDSLVNPIVVDRAPRLSWKLGGDPAGVTTGVAVLSRRPIRSVSQPAGRSWRRPMYGAAERFFRIRVWT